LGGKDTKTINIITVFNGFLIFIKYLKREIEEKIILKINSRRALFI